MEAVTVVARFRGAETGDDDFGDWVLSNNTIKHNEKHHEFNFDAVLNPSRTQEELYEAAGRKIINFFCDGYNATIFAYGQSGSGKTFSMLGPEEVTDILINSKDNIPAEVAALFGITPRATFHIFDNIREGEKIGTKYSLKVSYLEVYNEAINDILASPARPNLKLREFPNQGMVVIGLLENAANTPEGVFEAISNGTANRIVCSTGQNARSSRSHTVFVLSLEQVLADGTKKSAKINLVDLAGSEKLSKTGAQGQALLEAKNINLSLTTLGRCIKALTSGGGEHVPYRESKLTLILKESLSGAAMTTLIVTGSMRKIHQEETIGTMQFAERAKMVKTAAKSNTKRSYEELEKLFAKLTEEVKLLRSGINPASVAPGSSISIIAPTETDNKAFIEMQEAYEKLKTNSIKEIEILRQKIEKAEADQDMINYLEVHEEMLGYRDNLEASNLTIEKLSKEKEEERAQLEAKENEVRSKIDEFSDNIERLQQETKRTNKMIEEFEEKIKAKDSEIFSINDEVQKVKERKKELEHQVEGLEKEIEKQIVRDSEFDAEIDKIKEKIREAKEKKSELEVAIDKAEVEAQEISAVCLLLQKKESQFISEVEKLNTDKEALQAEYLQLKKMKENKAHESIKNSNEELSSLKAHNESLASELISLNSEYESIEKNPKLTEFNQLKVVYAEEKAKTVIEEINKLIHAKHDITSETQKISATHENLKETLHHHQSENLRLKVLLIEENTKLNKTSKEINDERLSRSRITKNIKAVEDTLAKAIKEAEKRMKTDEQIKITELIQNANIMRYEIDKKAEAVEKTKKMHNDEIVKIKKEILDVRSQKPHIEENLKKTSRDLEHYTLSLEVEKNDFMKNLAEKKEEIQRLKEIISANNTKINHADTQIEKLEADVRHKAAERDIERKNTLRQTIVPRKMSIMTAPIPKPSGFLGGVQLKKTGNKFLESAIKEAEAVAQYAPIHNNMYQVHYGRVEISALYANIDDYKSERVTGDEFIVEEEEYQASSSSDSD